MRSVACSSYFSSWAALARPPHASCVSRVTAALAFSQRPFIARSHVLFSYPSPPLLRSQPSFASLPRRRELSSTATPSSGAVASKNEHPPRVHARRMQLFDTNNTFKQLLAAYPHFYTKLPNMGFQYPTRVQSAVIPELLSRRNDVLIHDVTGSIHCHPSVQSCVNCVHTTIC